MKFFRAFVVAAVALCCTRSVGAQDVTITFHGTLTDLYSSPFADVAIGAPFTGAYTYSLATPDSNPLPQYADYRHRSGPYGVTVNFGSHTFHSVPSNPDFLIELSNDDQAADYYMFVSYNNSLVEGLFIDAIYMQLDDFSRTALSDTLLTGAPPDLTRWTQSFGLTIYWGNYQFFARGVVEGMEPGGRSVFQLHSTAAASSSRTSWTARRRWSSRSCGPSRSARRCGFCWCDRPARRSRAHRAGWPSRAAGPSWSRRSSRA
jgi:hypothetical protein